MPHKIRRVFSVLAWAILSVVVALLLAYGLDRLAGRLYPMTARPGQMDLVFPPSLDTAFASADFTFTVHTNSLGLRERELSPPQPGVCRIAVIGDSFTYGEGVEIEDTWLRRLEGLLQSMGFKVETVNMGRPGASPPEYSDLAERALPVVRPDVVIVAMLQGDDIASPLREETLKTRLSSLVRDCFPNLPRIIEDYYAKPRLLAPAVPSTPLSEERRNEIINEWRKYQGERAKSELDKMTPADRLRFEGLDPEVKEAFLSGNLNPWLLSTCISGPNLFTSIAVLGSGWVEKCIQNTAFYLGRIKHAVESNGASMMVISVPLGAYTNHCAMANYRRLGYAIDDSLFDSNDPDIAIQRCCEIARVPFFNVTQRFREHGDDPGLFYRLDGHLTARGHALFASLLAPVVAEKLKSLGWKN